MLATCCVYVTSCVPAQIAAGEASFRHSIPHGAKAWSTKSLSWASTSADERVSRRNVAKHVLPKPSAVKLIPTSKKLFRPIDPAVPLPLSVCCHAAQPDGIVWGVEFEKPASVTG